MVDATEMYAIPRAQNLHLSQFARGCVLETWIPPRRYGDGEAPVELKIDAVASLIIGHRNHTRCCKSAFAG